MCSHACEYRDALVHAQRACGYESGNVGGGVGALVFGGDVVALDDEPPTTHMQHTCSTRCNTHAAHMRHTCNIQCFACMMQSVCMQCAARTPVHLFELTHHVERDEDGAADRHLVNFVFRNQHSNKQK